MSFLVNILSIIDYVINQDWSKFQNFIKLSIYVNCAPDFTNHAQIANGASDLLYDLFQERGKHSRLAVGTNSLPLDSPVEIDAIVKIKPEK